MNAFDVSRDFCRVCLGLPKEEPPSHGRLIATDYEDWDLAYALMETMTVDERGGHIKVSAPSFGGPLYMLSGDTLSVAGTVLFRGQQGNNYTHLHLYMNTNNAQSINLPIVLHTTTNTVANTGFFTSNPALVFATMSTFSPYANPHFYEPWELEPVELPDWFPQCECGEPVSAGDDFCLDCLGTQVQDAPLIVPGIPEQSYYSFPHWSVPITGVYQTLHMGQDAYLTSKFSTTNVRTYIGSDPALSTDDQIVIKWTVSC